MSESYLPTSPGLTRPALALRQGTEAAVFNTLGASITIMGDPISNSEVFGEDFSPNSHLTLVCRSKIDLLRGFDPATPNMEDRDKAMAMMMMMTLALFSEPFIYIAIFGLLGPNPSLWGHSLICCSSHFVYLFSASWIYLLLLFET